MNRRGFLKGLGGIFLAGAAPAIVRADSLMRVVPRETVFLTGRWIVANQEEFAQGIVGSLAHKAAQMAFNGWLDRLVYEQLRESVRGGVVLRSWE